MKKIIVGAATAEVAKQQLQDWPHRLAQDFVGPHPRQPGLPPGAGSTQLTSAHAFRAAAHRHGNGAYSRLMNQLLKMDRVILHDWASKGLRPLSVRT